jgi:hypothetical protein
MQAVQVLTKGEAGLREEWEVSPRLRTALDHIE